MGRAAAVAGVRRAPISVAMISPVPAAAAVQAVVVVMEVLAGILVAVLSVSLWPTMMITSPCRFLRQIPFVAVAADRAAQAHPAVQAGYPGLGL